MDSKASRAFVGAQLTSRYGQGISSKGFKCPTKLTKQIILGQDRRVKYYWGGIGE
jgi:hypothetical protein